MIRIRQDRFKINTLIYVITFAKSIKMSNRTYELQTAGSYKPSSRLEFSVSNVSYEEIRSISFIKYQNVQIDRIHQRSLKSFQTIVSTRTIFKRFSQICNM